ncbi:CHASE domain-containing protein [Plasmodiophora brassicae]
MKREANLSTTPHVAHDHAALSATVEGPPISVASRDSGSGTDASSTGTKSEKKSMSFRLSEIRLQSVSIMVVSVTLIVAMLSVKVMTLRGSLVVILSDNQLKASGYVSHLYQAKVDELHRASLAYDSPSSVLCTAMTVGGAGPVAAAQRQLELERDQRQIEIAVVVDHTGVVELGTGAGSTTTLTGFPDDVAPAQASMLVSRAMLRALQAPKWNGAPSWDDAPGDQVLVRVVATRLPCAGSSTPHWLVLGDAVTPAKPIGPVPAQVFAGVAVPGGDAWVTATSTSNFPAHLDLSQVLADAAGNGTRAIQDVVGSYTITSVGVPGPAGSPVVALLVTGMDNASVLATLAPAEAWNIPVAVVVVVLAIASVRLTDRFFIDPLVRLIQISNAKNFAEFNKSLREMRKNATVIYVFAAKVLATQVALLSIVFVTQSGLSALFPNNVSLLDVESGMAAGVLQARTSALQAQLRVASHDAALTSTPGAASLLARQASILSAGSVLLVAPNGTILASSSSQAAGHSAPVITDLLSANTTGSFRVVSIPTDEASAIANVSGVASSRAFLRLFAERTPGGGTLVLVDVLNGMTAASTVVNVLQGGFCAVYAWVPFTRTFALLSTALGDAEHGADALPDRGVLLRGVQNDFANGGGVYVESGVPVAGSSMTIAVQAYAPTNSAALVYVVRGADQATWNTTMSAQTGIQIALMVVELIASLATIIAAFLPMQSFLATLDKAFRVPSMSQLEQKRLGQKALGLINDLESMVQDATNTTVAIHRRVSNASKYTDDGTHQSRDLQKRRENTK